MIWKIELSAHAQKNLKDLDKQTAQHILRFLHDRLRPLNNPRDLGEALKGPKIGLFWKYRLGDYRVIVDIQDTGLVVLMVRIGHRRKVYR
ncbi:type II toxin-antitoxin system RelE family toxin [Candidatus Williamhamiltonella defendens]|uniref:type II toxin-antitoxin system RelE family toxin n=1 Tax=Candidatus Williamhamiltonella defendens TaxID=138072 RepID=UPI00030B6D6C|nr:type II toxin-antitoxin system RelE/ParE family toxin [Candidatus Hamiltonella defensa]